MVLTSLSPCLSLTKWELNQKESRGRSYFLVAGYKGQVENWGWDNICHQFALHFHLAWLLSIFLDSFRCYSVDGTYFWQTAWWASLGFSPKVQMQNEWAWDLSLFINLSISQILLQGPRRSCFKLQGHTCIAKHDWPWKAGETKGVGAVRVK